MPIPTSSCFKLESSSTKPDLVKRVSEFSRQENKVKGISLNVGVQGDKVTIFFHTSKRRSRLFSPYFFGKIEERESGSCIQGKVRYPVGLRALNLSVFIIGFLAANIFYILPALSHVSDFTTQTLLASEILIGFSAILLALEFGQSKLLEDEQEVLFRFLDTHCSS